jgi:uncharacterized protein (TIGR02217 family)
LSYVDIPFPECIAFGAQFEPQWRTTVVQTAGGYEFAVYNWSANRMTADLSFAVRTESDYSAILVHFNQVRGRARTFPFKNYLDFTATSADGVLLTLAGVAPTGDGTFYLNKRYGVGGNAYDKRISRPDNPAIVYRTRSAVTSDITGAGATITYTTGAVAITGHMSGDTYSWAGTFKLPCRYDTDALPAAIVNRQSGQDGELLVSCDSIRIFEVRE